MSFIKRGHKSSYDQISDKELVQAVLSEPNRKRKRDLQEELYERYVEKVYFRCMSLVKNNNEAEDITHDIMVKIFLKLSSFKGKSSLYTWIMAITYNHCMTYLDKKKVLRTKDFDDVAYDVAYDDTGVDLMMLKELQLNQLEQVFKLLKEQDKMLLLMYYKDGLSIKQMAATLNVGESAVKMRLKRSRDQLAKLINKLSSGK